MTLMRSSLAKSRMLGSASPGRSAPPPVRMPWW
jgi:hypothetical protein